MYLDRAAEVIKKCESDLRGLVSAAADRGDYTAVLQITAWAKALSVLLVDQATLGNSIDRSPSSRPKERMDKLRDNSGSEHPSLGYPRFVKHGHELIKIGWSKREKKEYQHRASYQTLEAVLTAVEKAALRQKIFPTESFLPLVDIKTGIQVPDYQVYVCLGWLLWNSTDAEVTAFRCRDCARQPWMRGRSLKNGLEMRSTSDRGTFIF
jgi:hypothetical protein